MKFNWGHRLVFFMVIFMVFIVVLVVAISRQKVDLVDQNYYEKGILYQEEINKFDINDSILHQIVFDTPNKKLHFETNLRGLEGTLTFYRPSDSALDFSVPFQLDGDGKYMYSTASLKKGGWKVTFSWVYGGQKMATEKQIVVE
jgi:hypothetical protein